MREKYEWFIKTDFSKYAGKWIATIGKKPSLAKIPTGDTLIL